MTTPPTSAAIEAELKSGWLTLWFNRPENRNALSQELTGDLMRALQEARGDSSVRGITLRGRGGVFCAGGDLRAFGQRSAAGARENVIEASKRGAELFDIVNTMPKLVIALVEGAATAGGFGLACCADVVICDAEAKFALTETTIGLSPAQISPFVIQRLGFAAARRLMLMGARFDGREAHELGLADFAAAGTQALEAIELSVRRQALQCAPGAIADTKALILASPGLDRAAMVQAAAETFADRLLSEEGREGVAAFLEKRKPRWNTDP